MNKLLVLDKDGTLVRPKSGNTFVQRPEDQELIEGVAEAIQRYVADGWTIAIASNQGGVAAGYKSLDDAIVEMQFCLRLCKSIGLTYGFLCPDDGGSCVKVERHHGENDGRRFINSGRGLWQIHDAPFKGKYRKPDNGMLLLAKEVLFFGAEVNQKLMIGDRPEDQGAAQAAGFDFMWVEDWRKQASL